MGIERRKFIRFDGHMDVRFDTSILRNEHGYVRDVSRQGLKLYSDRMIQSESTVELRIEVPDHRDPVEGKGRVAWARPCEGPGHGYDHGIELIDIDPEEKYRILDYAYHHWLETNHLQ